MYYFMAILNYKLVIIALIYVFGSICILTSDSCDVNKPYKCHLSNHQPTIRLYIYEVCRCKSALNCSPLTVVIIISTVEETERNCLGWLPLLKNYFRETVACVKITFFGRIFEELQPSDNYRLTKRNMIYDHLDHLLSPFCTIEVLSLSLSPYKT